VSITSPQSHHGIRCIADKQRQIDKAMKHNWRLPRLFTQVLEVFKVMSSHLSNEDIELEQTVVAKTSNADERRVVVVLGDGGVGETAGIQSGLCRHGDAKTIANTRLWYRLLLILDIELQHNRVDVLIFNKAIRIRLERHHLHHTAATVTARHSQTTQAICTDSKGHRNARSQEKTVQFSLK
jgi:hypothetical protein